MRIKNSGQAVVEFAILLPILILLVMGALDLGRSFFMKIVTTNAAREGAYYLSYHPDDRTSGYTGTIHAIQNEGIGAGVAINTSDITVTGCCTTGSPVEVTVRQTVNLTIFNFFTGPLQMTSRVRMLVQ